MKITFRMGNSGAPCPKMKNPVEPFDKVSLDKAEKLPTIPNGSRHILTMQDNFSKYCIAVPIPNFKTTTIAHAAATTLFIQYGAPRAILAGRGGSFVRKLIIKIGRAVQYRTDENFWLTTSNQRSFRNIS